MTIFGALIFILVVFEVASVLLPERLKNGIRDYRQELATAEMHSFANMAAEKTGYNFFSESKNRTCDSMPMFNCNPIMANE